MGAFYKTAAHIDRRGINRIRSNAVVADGRPHNVHDGIHCAHLVKMHVIRRNPMHLSFRFRHSFENPDRRPFDLILQGAVLNDFPDVGKMTVRMFLPFADYFALGSRNAVLFRLFNFQMKSRHFKLFKRRLQIIRTDAAVQKSAQSHIPADSRKAVKI